MDYPADLYIFGDQSQDVLKSLQTLLLLHNNAFLRSFLDEAFCVLQRVISHLPPNERYSFPRVETFGLLIDAIQKGRRHAATDSACVCIYEIASYVDFLAQKDEHHPPAASYFLGLCTGSIAAAAISCSKNIFDIAKIGLEAVTVSFRIGMHVHRRAEILGNSEPASWSAVMYNMQEEDIVNTLTSFDVTKKFPLSMQPYVSAVGLNAVTVSGPPTVLDMLLSSPEFSETKSARVPIRGPYHCSHAYSECEVERILVSAMDGIKFLDRPVNIPNLSCTSGTILEESTFGSLLQVLAREALVEQVRIDRVIGDLSKRNIKNLISINAQGVSSLAAALSRDGKEVKIERTPLAPVQLGAGIDSSKIAIVGFSGRFPEADDLDEFWDLLQRGLDVVKPVPSDRFDGEAHYDPTGKRKNTSRIKHGCWIREPGLFDAKFFQVSPREACQMDPAQRLALLIAYEALEMAGFVADRTSSSQRHRVGVYFGTTSDDWREINNGQDIDTYFIPGGIRAFIPGRINHLFKFSGPSISVDTACSSSLAAINVAVTALLKRECDTALAGGTNILTNPDNFAGLDRGHFLSPTGNCKTFDNDADGYCRADGIGTVVLKRLSDAIAEKDPIFGVIMGASTNHSAESVSITRPLAEAQERIFRNLLNETGVKPHDISFIEMHGTGTQAGDAVEMQSILNTFAWDHSRNQEQKLFLGSVKANVGHGESASGVTALIKVLLMMQKNKIPPHCGIKGELNHGFPTDLKQRGVHIAMAETEWTRRRGANRRAFINNFSAAGGNTALLIEDAPSTAPDSLISKVQDAPSHHVVTVSARSAKSLQKNLGSLATFIGDSTSRELLAHVSYTTTARRMHHRYRMAFVTSDLQHLRSSLLQATSAALDLKPVSASVPNVGFLFTGQGAQHTAMAQGLYSHVSSFCSDIGDFDAIAQIQGYPSILPLVDGSIAIEHLSPTVVQLGTCIIQIALARLWINLGAKPQYVIGHSLGEYAALHIAGVLSISDTIWLCGLRASLMEARCKPKTHCMLAVRASRAQLQQLIANTEVEIACLNGYEDTVLAGCNADADVVCTRLDECRHRYTKLGLPFAFHSAQVEPLLEELEVACGRVTFQAPKLPFVSTLLGAVVTSGGTIGPDYLKRHCREAVNFLGAVESAHENKLFQMGDICIEIGTHPMLAKMATSILGTKVRCCPSLRRNEDTFKTLSESLSMIHSAGVNLNWDEYHRDFAFSHKVVVLPNYNWDYENYWIQYEPSWCLTKGDTAPQTGPQASAPKPVRLSASVHEIVEQIGSDDQASIVIQSDLHDPELLQVSQEHRVNGLVLCPSSLYADVAYTLAEHLQKARYPHGREFRPDVRRLVAPKALVVNESGPQLFRAAMTVDWKSQRGSVELYSVDDCGKCTAIHAKCEIEFQDPRVWLDEWQRHLYLIQRSIKQLQQGVGEGTSHRVGRGMAYKLFSALMKYGASYQGMEEVIFDSVGLEATARVGLQPVTAKFALNPCWIDSFGHLTGFVMNSNDSLDLTDHVFVNHGWDYMRCSEPFSPEASYRTYVKMQPVDKTGTAYSGDVYVLREDRIVAVYGTVTFNKVPRRVLQMLLPSPVKKSVVTPGQISRQKTDVYAPLSSDRSNNLPTPVPVLKRKADPESFIFQQAMKVISDEIGIDQHRLTDNVFFADFGVDSLMTLTILSKIRESLDLDVPASLFEDCPSVKSLREYLCPPTSSSLSDSQGCSEDEISNDGASTPATLTSEANVNGVEATISTLMEFIIEETGTTSEELMEAEDLTALGLDSLLSLNILGRVREELGLDLPPDLFLQNTRLSDIKAVLGSILGEETLARNHPPATSVILQGGKSRTKSLFLLPDGSGSATSYIALPPISPDLCVIGLNCPYMKSPQDLKCSLHDLVDLYVAEIRRRQPRGPYNIGGWSAGGFMAYDAAQRLVDEGEVVERLILIDSPDPIGIEKLPPRIYDLLNSVGIFGGYGNQKPPEWLIPHFLAYLEALEKWEPAPFRGRVPATSIIWAKDGVAEVVRQSPQPGDGKHMRWLLENRTDSQLGFNGWDTLLKENIVSVVSIAGAHHFSMVREPHAAELAGHIRRALA